MPEGAPRQPPPPRAVIGLPGKNIKLARPPPAHDAADGAPPRLDVGRTKQRSKSPLGITLDTTVAHRNAVSPELLSSARTPNRRRSSMLVIPTFEPERSRVTKRKDAPAPLALQDALSPFDRYVPILLSNPNTPEFLRLNSKHGKRLDAGHAPRQTPRDVSPATRSAPPIIIVTPTDDLPLSPPRRTRTDPVRTPRSSSIYTRNTRLFQTPQTNDGSVPPLPKFPAKYRLSSFPPLTPMTATTIFEEDEEPRDSAYLSPSSDARRATGISLETVLPTPLRNYGWWNILSPMLPQGLTRSFTAPARMRHAETDDEIDATTPLLSNDTRMSADLSRGIADVDAACRPFASGMARKGTQRTIPTTGEAAEYYDPHNEFETVNDRHESSSAERPSAGETSTEEAIPAGVGDARGRQGSLEQSDLHSIHLTPAQEVAGGHDDALQIPDGVSHQSGNRGVQPLGSAFETPRPFIVTSQNRPVRSPDTPLELMSPPVVVDASVGHFHTGKEVSTRGIERSSAVNMEQQAATEVDRGSWETHGRSEQAMHYRGFSGAFASPETPMPDHESHTRALEDVYAHDHSFTHPDGSSPYNHNPTSPSPDSYDTSPDIQLGNHRYIPGKASEEFTGHEKAIAMGMDKPAEYRMYEAHPNETYWHEKVLADRRVDQWEEEDHQRKRWFDRGDSLSSSTSKKGKLIVGAVAILLLIAFVTSTVLAMTLVRRPTSDMAVGAQWLNLTNYPPIPTGISTIGKPSMDAEASCVPNSDLWSCSMPKEQQYLFQSDTPDVPNFRLEIRFIGDVRSLQNSTSSEISKRQRPSSLRPRLALLKARDIFSDIITTATPAAPSINDRAFLGNTTDGTQPFEGENTPFVMSVLALTPANSTANSTVSAKRDTPSEKVPNAPLATNKTAAPATLYPEVAAQPLHLFNRGQASEHYGFYAYFTRSLFLSLPNGTAALNTSLAPSSNASSPANAAGGSARAAANTFCTWPQTRFHVRVFTRPAAGQAVSSALPPGAGNSSLSAVDFAPPGTMPLPVSVRLDRHGGDAAAKGVVCYDVDAQGRVDQDSKIVVDEDRGVGGRLVNPAPVPFEAVDGVGKKDGWGGVDGGRGGCGCEWTNWT